MTKSRLIPDPVRGPVVTQIFDWRVTGKLSIKAITARLNADKAAYPALDERGWAKTTVVAILANPKYTGHMVYGRTRKTGNSRKARPVPPDQWIWSPRPVHPPLADRATWDEAQKIGKERGNVRDPETPTRQPGRRYLLRSRIRCRTCQRRMCGIYRPGPHRHHPHLLQMPPRPRQPPPRRRPPRPRPRLHPRRHPHHRPSPRSSTIHLRPRPRRASSPPRSPPTAAGHAEAQARQITYLNTQLTRIDTAERGLISELEAPADPADPAAAAYRDPHPRPLRRAVPRAHQDRS